MRMEIRREYIAECLAILAKKLAFLAGMLLVFALLKEYIPRNTTYEYTETEKNAVNTQLVPYTEEKSSLYTLRLCDGVIGVYRSDGTLEYTAEIDPELLTDYDLELLREGICAEQEELSELIGGLMS